MISFMVAVSGTTRGGVSFQFFLDFVTPRLLGILGGVSRYDPFPTPLGSLGCYHLYIPV